MNRARESHDTPTKWGKESEMPATPGIPSLDAGQAGMADSKRTWPARMRRSLPLRMMLFYIRVSIRKKYTDVAGGGRRGRRLMISKNISTAANYWLQNQQNCRRPSWLLFWQPGGREEGGGGSLQPTPEIFFNEFQPKANEALATEFVDSVGFSRA